MPLFAASETIEDLSVFLGGFLWLCSRAGLVLAGAVSGPNGHLLCPGRTDCLPDCLPSSNVRPVARATGDIPDAEAYRILRTNIEFNRSGPDARTISIVSGGPGEGKSTTLVNLAVIAAQGGYSTLIVDADLRRPVQHTMFDVDNKIGLTNYLTTDMPLEDAILSTKIKNLSLLPSGALPADAVGILNSQRMSDLIAELKTRYDIILFDSPPMLGVSDFRLGERSRSQHYRCAAPPFSARHADASEAGYPRRRGQCPWGRLEQCRSQARRKLLLLHKLLRLLSLADRRTEVITLAEDRHC